MKRYGAVITFKAGVTKAQAERVLQDMATSVGALIDDPRMPDFKSPRGEVYPGHKGVHEYDDSMGGPTWYVP